jgi:glycerate 2-kinase
MKNKFNTFSADLIENRVLDRNKQLGSDACAILAKAVQAVDPYVCLFNTIHFDGETLIIGNKQIPIDQYKRIFLIGFGKAAVPMAEALLDKLGEKILKACVITKDNKFYVMQGRHERLVVYLGGHPVPTKESVIATKRMLSSLPNLKENDLILVVISGGGSALFTDPIDGVSLDDMQKMTQVLLNCGADIYEINTLRKHLDSVKGGRLAARLMPASVESLILSDVIGDRLDMIASGPTVEDPTTYHDALKILEKYGLKDKIPGSIHKSLEKGRDGQIPETLKTGQLPPGRVDHHLVGTNFIAAEAARQHAYTLGYHTLIISTFLSGRTDHLASFLAGILQTQWVYNRPIDKPACLIFGGEPTVNVIGDGLGGRNMDLTLRLVKELAGKKGVLFISFATDGDDGPTDAAGAVTDGLVLREGIERFGLDIDTFIINNDSYHYFEKVGGLIKTGATGTNVNDLILMLFDS